MKTKILMVALLIGFSSILMAQTTEVVPKKQGTSDQVLMSKEKRDAFQAQRSSRLNEMMGKLQGMTGQMGAQRGAAMGLNLTDDQKKAFKQGIISLHKQILPLKNELGEAEAHQKTLMSAEKTDLGAINKNIEKIGAIKVEMAKVMVKHRFEMRAQLTEDQRLKLDMTRAKMQRNKGMKQGKGMQQGRMMRGNRPGMGARGMGQRGMNPQDMGPGMM